ncbi:MAG: DUF6138 family protein [Propionibacteriaceae bacterium]|nr:DUF6138 family protein [Propionibacteriaceae bacterium]
MSDYFVRDEIHRDPVVKEAFDAAVLAVENGTARRVTSKRTGAELIQVGKHRVLGDAVLDHRLRQATAAGEFAAEPLWEFTEKVRRLLGWDEMRYILDLWVELRIRDPFFHNLGDDFMDQHWVLKGEPGPVDPEVLDFACRIAVGHLKYGPSWSSVSAEQIFGFVTALGSDLPARLKKQGTGSLPPELASRSGDGFTAKANDATAVVRITLRGDEEALYEAALQYLVELLESGHFPRSYAVEFRGPVKEYLPCKGLPRKGINQLFACAVRHLGLHALIERYARAAMVADEWYTNIPDENPALPGTFAVVALAWADVSHVPLLLDYLGQVDGEHQMLHNTIVANYAEQHGFTREALACLVECAFNTQGLPHRKVFAQLIANPESLGWLAAFRDGDETVADLRAHMTKEKRFPKFVWQEVVHAIWGDAGNNRPAKVIAAAPEELRERYEELLA